MITIFSKYVNFKVIGVKPFCLPSSKTMAPGGELVSGMNIVLPIYTSLEVNAQLIISKMLIIYAGISIDEIFFLSIILLYF